MTDEVIRYKKRQEGQNQFIATAEYTQSLLDRIAEQEETIDAQDEKINFYVTKMNENILKRQELEKEIDSYKAFESHYEEIEEDAKVIAKENEELRKKIETKKCCFTCEHKNDCVIEDYNNVCEKWE